MSDEQKVKELRDMADQFLSENSNGKKFYTELADTVEVLQTQNRELLADNVRLRAECEAAHSWLRAFRHSVDTNKPFPSMEKLEQCLSGEVAGGVMGDLLKEQGTMIGRLQAALKQIAEYDGEPIWMDDRDDAANDMLSIAREALNPKEEE